MQRFRLDKMVSELFSLSRSVARKEILAGNVRVNGETVKQGASYVTTEDEICYKDTVGSYQKYFYIMMNKPEGVLSATKDTRAATALDLLSGDMKRRDLFVAGRLDKNTTGFLLITNDGDFAHNILSPKNHIPKTYIATLEKTICDADIAAFAEGIALQEFICKPAMLKRLSETYAQITIVEGKFHQIKRMFHARSNEVLALHRTHMGGLALDPTLSPGQARYITSEELKLLKGETV